MRDGTLMAQAFDPDKVELSGEPAPVAERVGSVFQTAYFSASPSALMYRTSNPSRPYQFTWFDANGKPGAQVGESATGTSPTSAFRRTGTRVVYRKGFSQSRRSGFVAAGSGARDHHTFHLRPPCLGSTAMVAR